MAEFSYQLVEDVAKELYIRALKYLPPDVKEALEKAYERETNETAKEIFNTILNNLKIAEEKSLLICQDTGLPIYMVKLGSKFPVDGAKVTKALGKGAERATLEHPFRGSSTHPLTRVNPQTSVGPGLPVIHWEFDEFDQALDFLASVPEDLKDSLAVILLHGETLYQAEKFQAAESFFNDVLETYGFNEQIARALARVYEELDRNGAALDIYRNIMETCRSCHTRIDPIIKEKYADLSFESGVRNTGVLEIYLSLAQEIPVRAHLYYRRVSHIYKSQGNHNEAARFEKIAEDMTAGDNTTP